MGDLGKIEEGFGDGDGVVEISVLSVDTFWVGREEKEGGKFGVDFVWLYTLFKIDKLILYILLYFILYPILSFNAYKSVI